MQITGLLKRYTLPSLLDKLSVIECFEQPGRVLKVGEMPDEQRRLYHELGGRPPGSLRIGGNIGSMAKIFVIVISCIYHFNELFQLQPFILFQIF